MPLFDKYQQYAAFKSPMKGENLLKMVIPQLVAMLRLWYED
jgi:hypothetical protein